MEGCKCPQARLVLQRDPIFLWTHERFLNSSTSRHCLVPRLGNPRAEGKSDVAIMILSATSSRDLASPYARPGLALPRG